ncbi:MULTISPECIES: phage baseplate assembly protein [unclassified Bradyrhizobium]|uniref:phage baseplate assembly protein n=1 Tax=unclassified Bradyrhizobium TaxID=2631580 RepID=UPI0029169348|nr:MULTISPECIES: hypothetical protein [unclassified Bradyrhizobium]
MPRTEIVTVNGFVGFEEIAVTASFHHAARSFTMRIAAEMGPIATAWRFKAGTEIIVASTGDPIFTGFVDRYQPRNRKHEQAHIIVSGRTKGQDFLDSSAVHKTNQFKNKTPVEIAQELDYWGVIWTDQQLDKVPVYRITPGETCFRCTEKLIREQGLFAVGQADGRIKITKAGQKRQAGPLIEGINIEESEADHNWSGRHSDIIVRGQQPYGHGEDALQIEQIARDAKLGRYRPIIVIHDGDTDNKRAKKRAQTRRDREAGNALRATITAVGHHDDGGDLWEPGNLVYVESPFLAIEQDMAIEQCVYRQDRDGGTLTDITVADPAALGGKGQQGGSAGDAWSTDAGDD